MMVVSLWQLSESSSCAAHHLPHDDDNVAYRAAYPKRERLTSQKFTVPRFTQTHIAYLFTHPLILLLACPDKGERAFKINFPFSILQRYA